MIRERIMLFFLYQVFGRKTVVFPPWTDKSQICTLCENNSKSIDKG